MELDLRRLKDTPYKIVSSKGRVIGMFEYNKFVSAANLTERQKLLASKNPAKELVEHVRKLG
jgi:hypothetical protein